MENDSDLKKRKTLSLNLNVANKTSRTDNRGKVAVEVRKKRRGLTINVNSKTNLSLSSQKLTDQEFKTRVKVLREAIKNEHNKQINNLVNSSDNKPDNKPDSKLVLNSTSNSPGKKSEQQNVLKASTFINNEPVVAKNKNFNTPNKPVIFRANEFNRNTNKKVALNAKQKNLSNSPNQIKKPNIKSEIKMSASVPPVINIKQQNRNKNTDNKKKVFNKAQISEKRNNSSSKFDKLAIERALNDESFEKSRSLASIKRARLKQKTNSNKSEKETIKVVRTVLIPDSISVSELANRMAVRASEIVKYLMSMGTMVTINQFIDGETAEIVCTAFGHIVKRISDNDFENDLNFSEIDKTAQLSQRAPIVTVMGHVDHGKTTLLDTLRKTAIAQKEAGGITQHVAAYQVGSGSRKITFIDTPGHAAFSNIRARGTTLTDIIVLVVAADDGIKEQTIEVIKQAKAQKVPLVVAINKIDKPDININKVKNDLMNYDVLLEEFGGDVLSVEISARQNINLDKLIDAILLQAEILNLKANSDRAANGTILEVKIEKGRGIVASVIVQGGTLKNGDTFVAGTTFGKVRAMSDGLGHKLLQATPSMPIDLIGFDKAPEPGDTLIVLNNEQSAREIAEQRSHNKKFNKKANVKSINQMIESDNIKKLNLLVKADVYGSLEAIEASLSAIQHPEISVKLISKDIGVISESDIDFARTSDAVVIGFNVNTTDAAKSNAKLHNIKIINHSIIYNLSEEIKNIMSSMLSPIIEEQYIGTADVKKLFTISRLGTVAGCYVSDGVIKRNNSQIKVIRNGKCLFEGKIKSMKHEKDEIKESKQNHECGILSEGFNDYKEGDKIECYEIIQKSRTI